MQTENKMKVEKVTMTTIDRELSLLGLQFTCDKHVTPPGYVIPQMFSAYRYNNHSKLPLNKIQYHFLCKKYLVTIIHPLPDDVTNALYITNRRLRNRKTLPYGTKDKPESININDVYRILSIIKFPKLINYDVTEKRSRFSVKGELHAFIKGSSTLISFSLNIYKTDLEHPITHVPSSRVICANLQASAEDAIHNYLNSNK